MHPDFDAPLDQIRALMHKHFVRSLHLRTLREEDIQVVADLGYDLSPDEPKPRPCEPGDGCVSCDNEQAKAEAVGG